MATDFSEVPIIDVARLFGADDPDGAAAVAAEVGDACRRVGFFYVRNHGVDRALVDRLFAEGRAFFERGEEEKMAVSMARSDCYRGYFPLGGELTGGRRDWKAGLYFGAEDGDGPGRPPMHGPNLWPDFQPGLRDAVTGYMAALTRLGHSLMEAVALSLGLPRAFFRERFTAAPFTPFRLFWYPHDPAPEGSWGVGRHTDYGVLTLLAQDDSGGLQVQNKAGEWIDAPPVDGTFVVNIGDMLETWTSGRYRATPHRVVKQTARDRLSAPFFFDPAFDCVVRPLDAAPGDESGSVNYGEYIFDKVYKNFANFPTLSKAKPAAGGP